MRWLPHMSIIKENTMLDIHKIRQDFPILSREVYGKPLVYLDNAATSFPKPQGVSDRMKYYLDCVGANVNRSVYTAAQEAGLVTLTLRQRLARLFRFPEPPTHVILTPGATFALNTLISGLLRPGDHCIVSGMEHNAVMRPLLRLPGVAVSRLPCDSEGFADIAALPGLLRDNTKLVVMAHGSNVCGTVQDAEAIGRVCAEHGVPFALDAAQTAGHLPIDVKAQNIDMLSLSGHKFHGPKGTGVLYARQGIPLTNIIEGGAQERGKRAGTENVPGIMGLAAALKEACDHIDENTAKVSALRDQLIAGLSQIPHSALNGDPVHRLPGNVNFCFEGIEGESLLLLLDQAGICASSGSACTSGSLDPSHVLLAIGRPHEVAHGSLRLSLCEWNTQEDVDHILKEVPRIVAYLRSISPVWKDLASGKKQFML